MVLTEMETSQLRLVFYDGENPETGNPIHRTKSFNQVKTDATAEELYGVAVAFASLQERPLHNVVRRDDSTIYEG